MNIVKDDLIAKVDELSSEQEILRDEIRSLHAMRNRLRLRTDELEAEVKMLREEIENARKAAKSEEEVTFSFVRLMDFFWLTFVLFKICSRRTFLCRSANASLESRWLVFSWNAISTRNAGWSYKKQYVEIFACWSSCLSTKDHFFNHGPYL